MSLIFLDNVILVSNSFDAQLKDLDMVNSSLRETGILFNLERFCYFTDTIKKPKHIIKRRAVTIDKARANSLN